MSPKAPFTIVPPGDSPSAKLRVLIADDDRDNTTMLAAVLADEGHDVVSALRGDEALELSRLFRPDVVIADVNMPGVSGYALARELRQRHGNVCPLMIGMSGVWTQTSDRLLGEAAGFDHYLVKPYDMKYLLGLMAAFQGQSSEGRLSGTRKSP